MCLFSNRDTQERVETGERFFKLIYLLNEYYLLGHDFNEIQRNI